MDIWQGWLKAFHGLNCLHGHKAAALFCLGMGSCQAWEGEGPQHCRGLSHTRCKLPSPGCTIFSSTRSFLQDWEPVRAGSWAKSKPGQHDQMPVYIRLGFGLLPSPYYNTKNCTSISQWAPLTDFGNVSVGRPSRITPCAELLPRVTGKHSCQLPRNWSL